MSFGTQFPNQWIVRVAIKESEKRRDLMQGDVWGMDEQVMGGSEMSSFLHKIDLRTLSVTLREAPKSDACGLGEHTLSKTPGKLETTILEVSAGCGEVILLQVILAS